MAKKGTVNVKPAKNVQNNVIKSNQGNKKLGTTTTTPKKMVGVKLFFFFEFYSIWLNFTSIVFNDSNHLKDPS